jgi:protein-S-isoprenylcysteine O-methyltransferase Ste14
MCGFLFCNIRSSIIAVSSIALIDPVAEPMLLLSISWLISLAAALCKMAWMVYINVLLIKRFASAPYPDTQSLVVEGPFRYVRNPMTLGIILHNLAAYLFSPQSRVVVSVNLFLVFIIMTMWFKYFEEPDLMRRLGRRYEVYCENVPRWISRSTPYHFTITTHLTSATKSLERPFLHSHTGTIVGFLATSK